MEKIAKMRKEESTFSIENLLKKCTGHNLQDVLDSRYIDTIYRTLTEYVNSDCYPVQNLMAVFDAEDLMDCKSIEKFEEFIRNSEIVKKDCVVISEEEGTLFSLNYRIIRYHGYYYLWEQPEGGGNIVYLFKKYWERGEKKK